MESQEKSSRLDYPTTLDVVTWKDIHYQVVASGRYNDPQKDFYSLNPLEENPQTIRVGEGARFVRTPISDPPEGFVYRRDEGVKVTGRLEGGKIID